MGLGGESNNTMGLSGIYNVSWFSQGQLTFYQNQELGHYVFVSAGTLN